MTARDGLLAKEVQILHREAEQATGISNETLLYQNDLAEIWPNPFNKAFQLRIPSTAAGNCEILIFDIYGRVIKTMNVYMKAEKDEVTKINLEYQPGGFYLCTVRRGKNSVSF